jgi:S-DNA-T family DNA segregation ATPase FtsK/SpoIIIE
MRYNVRRLEETLLSFGVDIKISNVVRGPAVTRYEMELKPGVKMSKITSLHEDIALALGVTSVHVAAVPGKSSTIGIEVPNNIVTSVPIKEVLSSKEFKTHKSALAFAAGKDISGNYIIGDIAKMPHLLIAGTTGSGKSVCMNSIIVSLLYRDSPEDCRLIMIDPKVVELSIYNGVPHLLIPVVTDPKKAAGALQWAVTEMDRRYNRFEEARVRDLSGYNKKAQADPEMQPMPRIVIIIDELADLMMVAAKEVETSIARLAAKARAAGMHLVIATQRPSADVITGVIKANIPSRIAFAVSSAMESNIIMGTRGAEKLLGKGDMFYVPQGALKPRRVQGCFISDEEVEKVAEFVKASSEAEYSQEILQEIEQNATTSGKADSDGGQLSLSDVEGDEQMPDAVEVVLETKQASVSMLQRRLKLGYAHAARIMDEMEEKGIVGPFEGSKPRQLLITREQWDTMVGINPKAVAPAEPAEPEEDVPFDEDV